LKLGKPGHVILRERLSRGSNAHLWYLLDHKSRLTRRIEETKKTHTPQMFADALHEFE